MLFTWMEGQSSHFPAANTLSLPFLLSSQVSQSDLCFPFLFPAAAFSDSPSSQERRVPGIGKPVLCSSSDPPVNSRCPKPEEPTPSPSSTLKRQVGLLPVEAVLVKSEGTLIWRGGVRGSLCTPRGAARRFSGEADTA